MEKTIRLLAVLLAAQLVLALGLGLIGTRVTAEQPGAPMLAVEKDKIDRLTVEGPDQAKVVLAKVDGTWRLPESANFPADGNKIGALLNRLQGLKQGLPVATTAGAQERFKVADATFERRITLAAGDKPLAKLYLGTSQGAHQTHARAADQKAIYSIDLAAYDVPVKPDDWEDKTILEIPQTEIESIGIGGLHLERVAAAASSAADASAKKSDAKAPEKSPEPSWRATGLGAGEHFKPDAADKLAALLADLRFGAVMGQEEKAADALHQPELDLSVTRKGGGQIEYRLGKAPDKKDEYILKVSTRPEYFRLPSYTAQPLIDAAARKALAG
jgi:hypothetical protein